MKRFCAFAILAVALCFFGACKHPRNDNSTPSGAPVGVKHSKQNKSTAPVLKPGHDSPFDFNSVGAYTYISRQDGYSVSLPETHRDVERETADMDTPLGRKTRVTSSVESHGLMFLITTIPLPELNIMGGAQQLDSVRTFARALGKAGELQDMRDTPRDGTPAVSVRYTVAAKNHTIHFRALVLFRNAHLYQFQAGTLDPDLLGAKAVDRFFDSIDLLNVTP